MTNNRTEHQRRRSPRPGMIPPGRTTTWRRATKHQDLPSAPTASTARTAQTSDKRQNSGPTSESTTRTRRGYLPRAQKKNRQPRRQKTTGAQTTKGGSQTEARWPDRTIRTPARLHDPHWRTENWSTERHSQRGKIDNEKPQGKMRRKTEEHGTQETHTYRGQTATQRQRVEAQ